MLPALRNRKLSNISVGRKYQLTDKEVNIMSEIRRGDIWMVDFGVPEMRMITSCTVSDQ